MIIYIFVPLNLIRLFTLRRSIFCIKYFIKIISDRIAYKKLENLYFGFLADKE